MYRMGKTLRNLLPGVVILASIGYAVWIYTHSASFVLRDYTTSLLILMGGIYVFFRFRKSTSSRREDDPNQRVTVHDVATLEKEIADFDMHGAPTSTTLSGNELYLLEQGGYRPVQLVFGNVVWSMGARGLIRSVQRAFTRGEMVDYTRMINDARLLARNRMLDQALRLGATDVISVILDVREWADFIEVTATGTAVIRTQDAKAVAVAVGA